MKVVLATTLFSVMFVAIGCRQSGESSTSGWGVTNTAFNSKALNVCFEKRSYADVELLNTTPAILAHAQAEFSRTNLALVGLGLCGSETKLQSAGNTSVRTSPKPTRIPSFSAQPVMMMVSPSSINLR